MAAIEVGVSFSAKNTKDVIDKTPGSYPEL
jgi:hypothetical protein